MSTPNETSSANISNGEVEKPKRNIARSVQNILEGAAIGAAVFSGFNLILAVSSYHKAEADVNANFYAGFDFESGDELVVEAGISFVVAIATAAGSHLASRRALRNDQPAEAIASATSPTDITIPGEFVDPYRSNLPETGPGLGELADYSHHELRA